MFVQVKASLNPEDSTIVPDLVVTHEVFISENGNDGGHAAATSTPLSKSLDSISDPGDVEQGPDSTVVTTRAKYVSSRLSRLLLCLSLI